MTKKTTIPDFIFCENPIKNNDKLNNLRNWIYASKYLSLIEVIDNEALDIIYPMEIPQKNYEYLDQNFTLVLVQNNIHFVNDFQELEIVKGEKEAMTDENLLDLAWDFYFEYLAWEDNRAMADIVENEIIKEISQAPINEQIVTMRKLKKMTQKDLALACGVSINSIRNYESGKYDTRFMSVLKFLGIM